MSTGEDNARLQEILDAYTAKHGGQFTPRRTKKMFADAQRRASIVFGEAARRPSEKVDINRYSTLWMLDDLETALLFAELKPALAAAGCPLRYKAPEI